MPRNDDMVLGFVSHRCNDYDSAPWRISFEEFLKSKGIKPLYGCFLEENFKGILSNNIRKAMENSDLYIATITTSWQKAEYEGWPKKEWEMWQEINRKNEKLERCFGLLIDVKRNQVQFIKDLISYKLNSTSDTEEVNGIRLFGDNPGSFLMKDPDFSRMNAQIGRFCQEVKWQKSPSKNKTTTK